MLTSQSYSYVIIPIELFWSHILLLLLMHKSNHHAFRHKLAYIWRHIRSYLIWQNHIACHVRWSVILHNVSLDLSIMCMITVIKASWQISLEYCCNELPSKPKYNRCISVCEVNVDCYFTSLSAVNFECGSDSLDPTCDKLEYMVNSSHFWTHFITGR